MSLAGFSRVGKSTIMYGPIHSDLFIRRAENVAPQYPNDKLVASDLPVGRSVGLIGKQSGSGQNSSGLTKHIYLKDSSSSSTYVLSHFKLSQVK